MCVLVCVNCCQWQSPGPVLCLTHPPAHLLQLRWQHRHLEHGRDSARGERVISDIAVDSVHQIVLKRISSAAATLLRGSGFFVFLFCSTGLHTVSWDLVLSLFNQTHSFTSVFCPNSLCSALKQHLLQQRNSRDWNTKYFHCRCWISVLQRLNQSPMFFADLPCLWESLDTFGWVPLSCLSDTHGSGVGAKLAIYSVKTYSRGKTDSVAWFHNNSHTKCSRLNKKPPITSAWSDFWGFRKTEVTKDRFSFQLWGKRRHYLDRDLQIDVNFASG